MTVVRFFYDCSHPLGLAGSLLLQARDIVMFVYEAAAILRDIICPHCKLSMRPDTSAPFSIFHTPALGQQCDASQCRFLKELGAKFTSYETGEMSQADLEAWLDSYRTGQ